jgi:hypothetical protein
MANIIVNHYGVEFIIVNTNLSKINYNIYFETTLKYT